MITCYEDLLDQCPVRSYFTQRVSLVRVMFSVRAVRALLCHDKSAGLQHVTRHAACIDSARRFAYCDDHLGSRTQLLTFFNRMMRFELLDQACQPLAHFRSCLTRNAREHGCDALAVSYVSRSLDAWIYHFCEKAGITVSAVPVTAPLLSSAPFLLSLALTWRLCRVP